MSKFEKHALVLVQERYSYDLGKRTKLREMMVESKEENKILRANSASIGKLVTQLIDASVTDITKIGEIRTDIAKLTKESKETGELLTKKQAPFRLITNPLQKVISHLDKNVIPEALAKAGYSVEPKYEVSDEWKAVLASKKKEKKSD